MEFHAGRLGSGMEMNLAEREGFEPSAPVLPAHTISSRAPSAARTSLQNQTGGFIQAHIHGGEGGI